MTTKSSQTPPSDDNDMEIAGIFTFTWDGSTVALSRYRSRFFLVYIEGNRQPNSRKSIHSALNAVSWHSNHHSRKGPKIVSFWLNCSRGNDESEDQNNLLYQFLHAEPPLVRRTGRKRKEDPAGNKGSTIDCEEFEVLVPEEGLIRQCYYCLSWEDNEHRYSEIKHDKYWCSKCKKKGRLFSGLTVKERSGTHTGDIHAVERESIYA